MAFSAGGRVAARKVISSARAGRVPPPQASWKLVPTARGWSSTNYQGPHSAGAWKLVPSFHGRSGFLYPPSASGRWFPSTWLDRSWMPSPRTLKICRLLGGLSSSAAILSYGYWWMANDAFSKSTKYTDAKLVDFQKFQNIATGVHHGTVRQFNDAQHETKQEISELRNKMLAMEQREFDHRKELMAAAEVIRNLQTELAAAAAPKAGAK